MASYDYPAGYDEINIEEGFSEEWRLLYSADGDKCIYFNIQTGEERPEDKPPTQDSLEAVMGDRDPTEEHQFHNKPNETTESQVRDVQNGGIQQLESQNNRIHQDGGFNTVDVSNQNNYSSEYSKGDTGWSGNGNQDNGWNANNSKSSQEVAGWTAGNDNNGKQDSGWDVGNTDNNKSSKVEDGWTAGNDNDGEQDSGWNVNNSNKNKSSKVEDGWTVGNDKSGKQDSSREWDEGKSGKQKNDGWTSGNQGNAGWDTGNNKQASSSAWEQGNSNQKKQSGGWNNDWTTSEKQSGGGWNNDWKAQDDAKNSSKWENDWTQDSSAQQKQSNNDYRNNDYGNSGRGGRGGRGSRGRGRDSYDDQGYGGGSRGGYGSRGGRSNTWDDGNSNSRGGGRGGRGRDSDGYGQRNFDRDQGGFNNRDSSRDWDRDRNQGGSYNNRDSNRDWDKDRNQGRGFNNHDSNRDWDRDRNQGGGGYGGGGRDGGGRGGGRFGGRGGNDSFDRAPVQQVDQPEATYEEPWVRLSPEEFRKKHDIRVQGEGQVPDPLQSFDEAGITDELIAAVNKEGFPHPTPIQAQAWPVCKISRDVVAIAKTGSGKTIAFLFPAFMHIYMTKKTTEGGPTVLVLVPTRELAVQIQTEAEKYGQGMGIKTTCLYGGAPRGPQIGQLRRGVHVAIGTPGRTRDMLQAGQLKLQKISYLVFDEADRMLDMGFRNEIDDINSYITNPHQTLFFSATWPSEVQEISEMYVTRAQVRIFIGEAEESLVANKNIRQIVEYVEDRDKIGRTQAILDDHPHAKALIFVNQKYKCDDLASQIRNFRCATIHGDKRQEERDRALKSFREGRVTILIATDVASRGLDITDITEIINFDFPNALDDYIHRIGRTARAMNKGQAFSFFTYNDSKLASGLIKIIQQADQEVPGFLYEMGGRGGGFQSRGNSRGGFGGGFRGDRGGPSKSYNDEWSQGGRQNNNSNDGGWSTGGRQNNNSGWNDRNDYRSKNSSNNDGNGRGGYGGHCDRY